MKKFYGDKIIFFSVFLKSKELLDRYCNDSLLSGI